jgi:hypothetical protein
VLLEADGGPRKLTLMATGSELHLAVEARTILQEEGVPTAVVSIPCALIFNEQDAAYQQAVLGDTLARVAVEAAVRMSWDRYLGLQGRFVGMPGSANRERSPTFTGSLISPPRPSCALRGTVCLRQVSHRLASLFALNTTSVTRRPSWPTPC